MKNRLILAFFAVVSFLFITACSPQDKSDYSLGELPTVDQLDFTMTPSASKSNVIEIKNTSKVVGVAVWDLGNGAKGKGETLSAEYPFKGHYTIVMTLYTKGGSVSLSKTLDIANDDMSLLNTPMYNALTNGASNLAGKTWVLDQYHDGHFGVGPLDDPKPSWWSCSAQGKSKCSLYNQEYTFTQVGVKLVWKNNGLIYTNESGRKKLASLGFTNSSVPADGDFDVAYTPKAAYTFSLNEATKTLTLSDDAFIGNYVGTSVYQIVNLTADELYIKCVSTLDPSNMWWYRLIPKEKNVKPA